MSLDIWHGLGYSIQHYPTINSVHGRHEWYSLKWKKNSCWHISASYPFKIENKIHLKLTFGQCVCNVLYIDEPIPRLWRKRHQNKSYNSLVYFFYLRDRFGCNFWYCWHCEYTACAIRISNQRIKWGGMFDEGPIVHAHDPTVCIRSNWSYT